MPSLRKGCAVLAALSAAVPAAAASAQSTSGALRSAQAQSIDMFARDRAIAVRDRPHPEYEALGALLGAFTLFPRLQMDAEYNDNIHATGTGERGDFIARVKPDLALESGWSRHAVQAYAQASLSRFQDFNTEDANDWSIGASGRIDVTRASSLHAGADYAETTEPRTASGAPTASLRPIQYDMAQAFLAASRVAGRLKLSTRGDLRAFDYRDGAAVGGAPIDQDSRDRAITSLSARADYAVSPATAVFFQVTGNARDYDLASTPTLPARDSTGGEALVGLNFELGAVSRGEVAVGYISQSFDDAAYDDIDGFAARMQLEWFPTELTTVAVTATRSIEDAGLLGSGGYLSSGFGASVDHELLRNVILSAAAIYNLDEYNGLDRDDERFSATLGGTYLLNRNLGLSLTASRLEQSSSGPSRGVAFSQNRLTISLVSQF